jgi:Concanavalin A-like lectin/glucanases superfamily
MARLITCIITIIGVAGLSAGVFAAPVAVQSTSTNIVCEEGCLLPPTGLIGWWPGDGNANDIQLGNDGTPEGGATFSAGFVGRAFHFDGNTAYIDVPDSPALHAIQSAVTVEAWINPQLSPSGAGFIVARRDPVVSEGFSLFINNDGYLRAQLQTSAYLDVDSTNPVIVFDGKWKHVALTADAVTGIVVLYLNGVPVELNFNGSISGLFADVSHLFIGQREGLDASEGAGGALNYKGLIDEVGVYNRALSAVEIRAIFSARTRGKCKPSGDNSYKLIGAESP